MGGGTVLIDAPHQIIVAGDSLTAGSQPGINEYAPYIDPVSRELLTTSYPYMLGEMLSGRSCGGLVLNLGRSGSTSRDWLPGGTWVKRGVKNFPLNGRPLDEIMESKETVKLCLMMLGTNDVNQSIVPDIISKMMQGIVGYEDDEFISFRENMIVTLMKLKEKGMIAYLAKIPPNAYCGGLRYLGLDRLLFFAKSSQDKLHRYTKMVNARIDEICASYPGLARPGPDFYALFEDRKDVWMKDRLHLNTNGYRLMAGAWASVLTGDGIVIEA